MGANDTGERLRGSSVGVAMFATNGTFLFGVGWIVDGDESTTVSKTGPIGRGCSIRIIGAAGTMELEDLEPIRSGAIEPDLLLGLGPLSRGLRTLPVSDMVGGAEVEPLFLAVRMTVGP